MRSSSRVLVTDDHPLTREGLSLAARSAVIGATVGTAGSIAEAATLLKLWGSCRMILLDFMVPDARGYTGFLTLQSIVPQTPIVVISAREDSALIESARALGAAAFLFKSRPLDEIAANLREVDAGRVIFPDGAGIDTTVASLRKRIADLSPAQHAVLMALTDGRSNKQIAFDLDVTEATVKAHLTAIFRKLGVSNRAQALLAMQSVLGSGAQESA
jgi:DNA-binding NarL/FixJ family response regulator